MPLESVSYINDLVITNPDGADQRSTADDHLRNIKKAIKLTFPNIAGEVSVSSIEINRLDGISANIETRLDAHLASISAINTTISGMATTIAANSASISAINTTISALTTAVNNYSASFSAVNATISAMTTRIADLSATVTNKGPFPIGWKEYIAAARTTVTGGVISASWIIQPSGWELSATLSGGSPYNVYFVHNLGVLSESFIPTSARKEAIWLAAIHGAVGNATASYINTNSVVARSGASTTFMLVARFFAKP